MKIEATSFEAICDKIEEGLNEFRPYPSNWIDANLAFMPTAEASRLRDENRAQIMKAQKNYRLKTLKRFGK